MNREAAGGCARASRLRIELFSCRCIIRCVRWIKNGLQRRCGGAALGDACGVQSKESKMRAYEFPVKVAPDGRLTLPDTLPRLLPGNQVVRVIVLVSEPTDMEEQAAWSQLTAEQFFAGYSEADAIYDRLPS